MLRLSYRKGVFICATDFASRSVPEKAGFQFIDKVWQTSSAHIAARLREHSDPWTEKYFKRLEIKNLPWAGRVPWPKELEPLRFQLDAARFALSRSACYLAADPGTGKSIIAALIANALWYATEEQTGFLMIYVCPPFLARNAEEEFNKWRVGDYNVDRFNGIAGLLAGHGVVIVPDNVLSRQEVIGELRDNIGEAKEGRKHIVLVPDEAHRFKNPEAQRTSELLSLVPNFDQVVYMSGTSLPAARPIELFPILNASAREVIDYRDRHEYGMRYCEGYEKTSSYGSEWVYNGCENEDELFNALKKDFMLRIPKSVLGLKGKREEIVVLEDDMPAKLLPLERTILHHYSPEDLAEGRFLEERGKDPEVEDLAIGTYQRLIGLAKIKPFWEFFRAFLEETDESVLVFAYHTEVIEHLERLIKEAGYGTPYTITGKTPMSVRHQMVRGFQDGKRRIFLLQRDAGGVGITLTRAKRVMILEPSWIDGVNTQCGDRSDRYGQTELVLMQYFVYRNSLDKRVLETAIKRREIINKL